MNLEKPMCPAGRVQRLVRRLPCRQPPTRNPAVHPTLVLPIALSETPLQLRLLHVDYEQVQEDGHNNGEQEDRGRKLEEAPAAKQCPAAFGHRIADVPIRPP